MNILWTSIETVKAVLVGLGCQSRAAFLAVRFWTVPVLVLSIVALSPPILSPLDAQELERRVPPGFLDGDGDGVNDLFRDADGDGVNDIDGRAYPHRFDFLDGDKDGINDLFRDVDGDGVNDLDGRFRDADGDGVADNVVDADGDRINDITGQRYSRRSLMGGRFGHIDEDLGRRPGRADRFVDEDGDGLPDRPHGRVDRFIDEDGDGIYDGRRLQGKGKAPTLDRLRQRRPPPRKRPPPPPKVGR
jgi:hypothetical protein